MSQAAAPSGTSSATAKASAPVSLDEIWAEDEVLNFDAIGEEGRFSDPDARKVWNKMYGIQDLNDPAKQKEFRKHMYMWFAKNSTSGRADLDSKITFNSKVISIKNFFSDDVLAPSRMRRFVRAKRNIREMEALLRLPGAEVEMRQIAKRAGVKPDLYIVAVDVAEYFNLTEPERAELARVKKITLANSADVLAPIVAREINSGRNGSHEEKVAPKPQLFQS